MTNPVSLPLLPYCPSSLAKHLREGKQRVLLYGEMGIGKSTLTKQLAKALSDKGSACFCIGADPGSPGFGLPGTVSLGQWREDDWHVLEFEALCSLDAARFRLPLLTAVSRLIPKVPPGLILVDAPGVVRGVAASELLIGLVELLDIDTILVMNRLSKPLPLLHEMLSLGVGILPVQAHPQATRLSKKARANKRTLQWQTHLTNAHDLAFDLSSLRVIGTPPPIDVSDAWTGRQCAFVDKDRTVSMGEIVALQDAKLLIRLPAEAITSQTLMVRDTRREENGLLVSAAPFASGNLQFLPPPDAMPYPAKDYSGGPRPAVKLGSMFATLINGVFGDPLLHLRLHQQQRSLLFDLGNSGRLPTRIAHQVSDVFISHAHIDHIGGFLWLLRSRLGDFPCCRIFGTPGLIGHIRGLVDGILWDRIGETGPRFEIAEIHGDRLIRAYIQTGHRDCIALPEIQINAGLIVNNPLFSVRTATLDHGTPVQAYAFECKDKLSVDKNALKMMGLEAGPWLNQLKRLIEAGDNRAMIRLPNHCNMAAEELAAGLLKVTPGEKLVYATDFADTEANRTTLIALAHKADFLFCEASFLEADSQQARRTGHLTTLACGEIANEADVKQLVPFHFSKRYEKQPEAVYREISQVCSRVINA